MSTSFRKDGDELRKLIAGDIAAWDALQLEWDDKLVLYSQYDLKYPDTELLHEAWHRVIKAVMRWNPGVDTRTDSDGNTVVIDRFLALGYVKCVLKRLAQKTTARQMARGGAIASLDAPISDEGGTFAILLADLDGRGTPKEAALFALLVDLETTRLGDEELAVTFVQALLDAGLLLPRAIERFIELADPPLDKMHQQVVIRRWLLTQEFWEIGRDLMGAGMDKKEWSNWASNQHQAALKRFRHGVEAALRP